MRQLKPGKEKIDMIAALLRQETLEPAQQEAERIVDEARQEAQRIIEEAKQHGSELERNAREQIAKERQVFETTLLQAGKQSVETLRQEIEEHLFNKELNLEVEAHTADPNLIAKLITCVVEAVEREGTATNLAAIIPQRVPAEQVSALLAKRVIDRLRGGAVTLGSITGGAQVRLEKENITIDISDKALLDLLVLYVRKDFRMRLFGEEAE